MLLQINSVPWVYMNKQNNNVLIFRLRNVIFFLFIKHVDAKSPNSHPKYYYLDFRNAENVDKITESSHKMEFNV